MDLFPTEFPSAVHGKGKDESVEHMLARDRGSATWAHDMLVHYHVELERVIRSQFTMQNVCMQGNRVLRLSKEAMGEDNGLKALWMVVCRTCLLSAQQPITKLARL